MKTMILDTSTAVLYVAFVENDQVIFETKKLGKNNHSDYFLKAIEEGLQLLHWQVKDFDQIVVGIGPGSYTGLRVSLTVAKMFAWTLHIPLYTVSSLDLLVSGYINQEGNFAVTSVAKSKHVYGKVVSIHNKRITEVVPEVFLEQEAFFALIKDMETTMVDENNYLVDIKGLTLEPVLDLHALSPNYMRREL